MARSTQLRMVPLKVPQIGLRAFQDELLAVKLDFLLWGWNWVCSEMVREWLRKKNQPLRGYRPHPERWQVSDWERILGRCAGEEGDLVFECESVQVTKEEEISFGALFKNCKSSKNRNSDSLGSDSVEGNGTTRAAGEGGIDQSPLLLLDQFLSADGVFDSNRAGTISLAVTNKSGQRKWNGEADQSQREVPAAPVRRRANHEPASQPKEKTRKLVLPASIADIGRAAETRNSPSSEEDVSAGVLGTLADLPATKARTSSEEARRPSGQGRWHAAHANMLATEKCLASEQVPFDDSTSGQEPSAQEQSREEPSAQRTSGQAPSAQTQLEQSTADEGRKEETRVPSMQEPLAQAPSAVAVRAVEAGPPRASSPTPLELLAGHGAEVAAEEVA
ncbi:hypothetical protein AXG93_2912s1140 [Marchantia polymorpha subsp. ruderalis]|uniref:Uncharacterized protein n=1 Tax=Marchantia polymorpha subsp. ruderalis TaxID=1480154 RepID=A0A176WIJ0_MARPO|nr:hypothetical protein AXG93_2912s1140 [Marchantia polymorpha subsp. ruderalis]